MFQLGKLCCRVRSELFGPCPTTWIDMCVFVCFEDLDLGSNSGRYCKAFSLRWWLEEKALD